MFVHTGDSVCSPGFYTYSAFIDSTRAFPDFGNAAGDAATNKREIAAFLAQISHETTGVSKHNADAMLWDTMWGYSVATSMLALSTDTRIFKFLSKVSNVLFIQP